MHTYQSLTWRMFCLIKELVTLLSLGDDRMAPSTSPGPAEHGTEKEKRPKVAVMQVFGCRLLLNLIEEEERGEKLSAQQHKCLMSELICTALSILPTQLSQQYHTHTQTHNKGLQVTFYVASVGGAADAVTKVLIDFTATGERKVRVC